MQWFRRLVERGAEGLVRRLQQHLRAVAEVLPGAAGVLDGVLAQVEQPVAA